MTVELVTLRDRFGIGAVEALDVIPAWEYDMLAAATAAAEPDGSAGRLNVATPDDDEAFVPEALRGLD